MTAGAPLRVLLAVDEGVEREAIRHQLAGGAFELLEERSGAAALVARGPRDEVIVIGETVAGEPAAAAIERLRGAGIAAAIVAIAHDEERAAAVVAAGATDAVVRDDLAAGRLPRQLRAAHRLARAEHDAAAARASIASSARRRAEVLSVVSHDLRGPLNAIGIALEVLKDDAIVGDKRARYVAATRRSIDRADRMVTDLLTAAQIEAGALRIETVPVTARWLLEQACRDHEPVATKSATAIVVGEVADVTVRADRERVLQALGNLIQNAIRHATGTREITLAARRTSGAVELSVRDGGPGISPDALPHLFDRYLHGADRRGGAGLGLTIVRGIARAHGGDARGGPAPEGGAEFTIVLPA